MPLRLFTTLRASSVASTTRVPEYLCNSTLHQLQKAVQRRTYASARSIHSAVKSNNVPWVSAAAVGTVGSLYYIVNQSHEPGRNNSQHTMAQETQRKMDGDGAEGSSADKLKGRPETESQNGKSNEKIGQKRIEKKLDPSQPGAGRPDPGEEAGLVGHGSKESPKASESGKAAPDKSDKPDPRGKPKSFNETSGKQEGISNADTHHSSQISKQADKSKKGEGVAESAKLKGTVSTHRPGPENKEERGKAQMNMDA